MKSKKSWLQPTVKNGEYLYDEADIYCSPQERQAYRDGTVYEMPEIKYDDEEYKEFMAQEIKPLPF